MHNHSIYDVLLWFIGFPLAFFVCWKLSNFITTTFVNAFAISALYFYSFIVSLFGFRVLFHYLRWVCPLVEYKQENSMMLIHRGVWLSIMTSIIATVISSVF